MDGMNRMTGFASGMDINQMVQDLMRAERQPLEPMQQNAAELQLKIDEYRTMNRSFSEFRNNTFDGVLRSSNMRAMEAASSNEAAVSVSAGAGTPEGTYTLSDISLAKAETQASFLEGSTDGSFIREGGSLDRQLALADQADELAAGFETGAFAIAVTNEEGEEHVRSFTIDDTTTLDDLLQDINGSGIGVQAFYDEFSGQMSMQRTDTGVYNETGSEIRFGTGDEETFTETAENAFSSMFGFDPAHAVMEEAENAVFTMNGLTEMERQSNQFEINGVQFSLQNETAGPVTVSVASDGEKMFDTVMAFVDDYNEMVAGVQEKTSEEYFRDYAPLTDEQRRDMTESEVEMWEERSNSGLLRRDSILTGALSQMRMQFYEPVEGTGDLSQITEIGITTSSDYQMGGLLEVDEEQLRRQIAENPEGVQQLFAADGETSEEQGIARRLRDTLSGTIGQIGERAGRTDISSNQTFTLGRELEQQGEQITNFERRMQQVEERHWRQFTAMEQAMARANAQAEQLMSSLGGMQMQ